MQYGFNLAAIVGARVTTKDCHRAFAVVTGANDCGRKKATISTTLYKLTDIRAILLHNLNVESDAPDDQMY